MDTKEFKVGDRVRVTRLDPVDAGNGFKVGQVLTVARVGEPGVYARLPYLMFVEEKVGYLHFDQVVHESNSTAGTKATNPKDAIGSTKLPLNLVPDTLPAMAALAFTEGAVKYGAFNWRVAGVRASIYEAALKRHLAKWWNGEDVDPATGVPHLASVIACAGIILDAALAGKLTDDRPPKVAMGELIDSLEAKVKFLKKLHKDKSPHHHTALDQA